MQLLTIIISNSNSAFQLFILNCAFAISLSVATMVFFPATHKAKTSSDKQDNFFHGIEFRKLNYK